MNANFIYQYMIYASHHAEYLTLYNFLTDLTLHTTLKTKYKFIKLIKFISFSFSF